MCQSSQTCENLPKRNSQKKVLIKSTSSAEAFPAKMLAAPALEKALKTAMGKLLAADYGGNTHDSLASLDQNSCWRKMFGAYCQPLLISDQEETSELFSGTWPTWGLMRNGRVTVLKPLARRTKEKECLLWPTAVASDGAQGAVIGKDDTFYTTSTGMPRKVNRNGTDGSVGLGRLVQMWPTPRANKVGGSTSEGYGLCLDEAVNGGRKAQNWPTPCVADIFTANLKSTQQKPGSMHSVNLSQCVNWPTPAARDWKDSGDLQKLADSTHQACVPKMVAKLELGKKGNLSADWVEILMGLPIGWTDIEKSNEDLDEWPGWPAPMNANKNWGTPAARDGSGPSGLQNQKDLPKDVKMANSVTGQYPYEPPRVVEGQKNRAKRLKCLGNGCCPSQIYPIFKMIMEAEK